VWTWVIMLCAWVGGWVGVCKRRCGRFEGGTGWRRAAPTEPTRVALHCSARQCAGHAILSRQLSLVVMPTLAGKAARK
jgi:hypothetical protein